MVVIDEIGFHQATSVAELLADRGCHVEVVTNGMVVGQDLGITLDLETWWMRATAKGIVQTTDSVPMGVEGGTLNRPAPPDRADADPHARLGGAGRARQPGRGLYHELQVGAGVPRRDRVGDCVAPRRAHAAVVEGERAAQHCERRAAVIAVVPVRDGELPAGGDEAVAECGGRALLVGGGTRGGRRQAIWPAIADPGAGVGHRRFRPGAWAATLAPRLAGEPVIVLPASPDGRDLAPRLAHVLGRAAPRRRHRSGTDRGGRLARQGGLVIEDVTADRAFVATLQPGVRGVEPIRATRNQWWTRLEPTPASGDPGRRPSLEVLPPDPATMDLAEARRIVAGGAGLDSADRFARLAGAGRRPSAPRSARPGSSPTGLGRARAPDRHDRRRRRPRLYLAFGISGAVQHTSGLGQPDHIVSVNTDPTAR